MRFLWLGLASCHHTTLHNAVSCTELISFITQSHDYPRNLCACNAIVIYIVCCMVDHVLLLPWCLHGVLMHDVYCIVLRFIVTVVPISCGYVCVRESHSCYNCASCVVDNLQHCIKSCLHYHVLYCMDVQLTTCCVYLALVAAGMKLWSNC